MGEWTGVDIGTWEPPDVAPGTPRTVGRWDPLSTIEEGLQTGPVLVVEVVVRLGRGPSGSDVGSPRSPRW